MEEALAEAAIAAELGEIPVGAVIVKDGRIIARGHNMTETRKDPTAHAEMLAIREEILNWQEKKAGLDANAAYNALLSEGLDTDWD